MSILDMIGNTMKAEDGLEIINGSNFKVRIAKTKSQLEEADFTKAEGKYLIYPSSVGITPTTEQLSKDYVGSATSDIYAGATTYAGDVGFGGFPNSNAFYTSLIWANKKTKATTSDIMMITAIDNFALKFTVDNEINMKVSQIEILRDTILENGAESYKSDIINIATTTKNSDLIDAINNIEGMSARLIIGSADDIVDFSTFLKENKLNDELVFGYNRIAIVESALMTDEDKKKYPQFVHILMPRIGEVQYYNILLQDTSKNMDGTQYIGCQSKSMNFNFANKSLTEISASLWVTSQKNIAKDTEITQERTEQRDVVMAQTEKYPTRLFVSGLEATSVSDATVAFEWTKEDKYNISMMRYNAPNGKYTLTLGGNAVFNKQSKELFYDRILNGQRQSFVLSSVMRYKQKDYPFVFCFADVSGQPSMPSIEPSDLQVALNGFQAMEQSADMNSNYVIAFTDREELF